MIDYRKSPLGYLVRAAHTEQGANYLDPPLDADGEAQGEDVARFLSYEQIGQVVIPNTAAAARMAEIIFSACISSQTSPDVDDSLGPVDTENEDVQKFASRQGNILSYLAQPEMGLPCVLICYQPALDAVFRSLYPDSKLVELVAEGGIVSVHRVDGKLILAPRTMVTAFEFDKIVENLCARA